jgi:hypothetical protein
MIVCEYQSESPMFGAFSQVIFAVVSTDFSSISSFLLAWEFHFSLSQLKERTAQGQWPKPVVITLVIFVLFVVIFSTSFVLYSVGFLQFSTITAILLTIFKVLISAYFVWGHWKTLKIFGSTGSANPESEQRTKTLGKRMVFASFFNFFSLITAGLLTMNQVIWRNRGYVLLPYTPIIFGLTNVVEVISIPTKKSRQEALASVYGSGNSHGSKKGNSQSSNADYQDDDNSCFQWLRNSPKRKKKSEVSSTIPGPQLVAMTTQASEISEFKSTL